MIKKLAVCLLATVTISACSSDENMQYPAPETETSQDWIQSADIFGSWEVAVVTISLDTDVKGLEEVMKTDKCQIGYYKTIIFNPDGTYVQNQNLNISSNQTTPRIGAKLTGTYFVNRNVITLILDREIKPDGFYPNQITELQATLENNILTLQTDVTLFMQEIGLGYYASKYKELDQHNILKDKHWSDPSFLKSAICKTTLQK